jgi:hypothetical protein
MERKPVHMIFAAHGSRDMAAIDSFGRATEEMVQAHPRGKVAVLCESYNLLDTESNSIMALVDDSVLPSKALADMERVRDGKKLSTKKLSREWGRKRYLSKQEPNFKHKIEVLDKIATTYPNRISLIFEGHPTQESIEIVDLLEDEMNLEMALSMAKEGNFAQALPLYKEHIAQNVKGNTMREENITRLADKKLQEPDIVGLVGKMGTVHTPISHALKSAGHEVIRTFPDREEGSVTFTPTMEIKRRLTLHPETKISEDEYTIALVRRLISIYNPSVKSLNKQRRRREVWKSTKNITMEDVARLENNIQKLGVKKAISQVWSVGI